MKHNGILLKCFLLFITISSCSKSDLYPLPTIHYNGTVSSLTPSVGPAGNNNNLIYYGTGEPALELGVLGDYYLDISQGLLYGPKTDFNWGDVRKLNGSSAAENKIYSGYGVPDKTIGATGDYFLDTQNFLFYGPKTATGWGDPLQL